MLEGGAMDRATSHVNYLEPLILETPPKELKLYYPLKINYEDHSIDSLVPSCSTKETTAIVEFNHSPFNTRRRRRIVNPCVINSILIALLTITI